jgi:Esterase/lipase
VRDTIDAYAPGGGFMFCSESDTVALGGRLMGKGVGVICTYLYPVARDYRWPQVIIDLMRSIKILRDHADEWGLDPDKIIISGNSAGAFICMSTGNLWNRPDLMAAAGCTGEEGKPNAMVLGFGPMYCGQQTDDGIVYVPNGDLVGPQTPPAFFHHARLDTLVSVYQTIAMISNFEKQKRPFAAYISSCGGHGETGSTARILGADGTVGPSIDDWFEPCWRFLQNQLKLQQLPQPMPPMFAARGEGAEGERPAMPPMMAPPPVVPEGSVPVTPADMPLGQADHIHMPFNAGFMDKDFTTYR